ncbi:hypothetical protein OROGR_029270 [Orobanche gracilis]
MKYENRYSEDVNHKAAETEQDIEVKEVSSGGPPSRIAIEISKQKGSNVKPPASEQDLDAFLLGDLEDGDDGPEDGYNDSDDDFDKI